jgi:tRNA (cmo5U34)-methyltransferase
MGKPQYGSTTLRGVNMPNEENVWRRPDLAKTFLEDIRDGIPLAAEQIDVLLRIVRNALPKVERVLDLGCGDGILGRTVLAEYRGATAVFLDFATHMIEAAKEKADAARATFVVQDLGTRDWMQSVGSHAPFDLILSGLAIHHLPDARKRELYQEIFSMLTPGGLFLNLEHVAFRSAWAKEVYDELFIDSLWSHHQKRGGTKARDSLAAEWYCRLAKAADILAPVDLQCRWLAEIGFVDVDCFFKLFELALFGGRKPSDVQSVQSA